MSQLNLVYYFHKSIQYTFGPAQFQRLYVFISPIVLKMNSFLPMVSKTPTLASSPFTSPTDFQSRYRTQPLLPLASAQHVDCTGRVLQTTAQNTSLPTYTRTGANYDSDHAPFSFPSSSSDIDVEPLVFEALSADLRITAYSYPIIGSDVTSVHSFDSFSPTLPEKIMPSSCPDFPFISGLFGSHREPLDANAHLRLQNMNITLLSSEIHNVGISPRALQGDDDSSILENQPAPSVAPRQPSSLDEPSVVISEDLKPLVTTDAPIPRQPLGDASANVQALRPKKRCREAKLEVDYVPCTPVIGGYRGVHLHELASKAEAYRLRYPGETYHDQWLMNFAGSLSDCGQYVEGYRCYIVGCKQVNKRRDHITTHIYTHLGYRPYSCKVPGW